MALYFLLLFLVIEIVVYRKYRNLFRKVSFVDILLLLCSLAQFLDGFRLGYLTMVLIWLGFILVELKWGRSKKDEKR